MFNTQDTSQSARHYIHWLDSLVAEPPPCDTKRPQLSFGILLWPGFPLMSLTAMIEPLRHVADFGDQSRPIDTRWFIMGEDPQGAVASCGLSIEANSPYRDPASLDYIVLIGGLLAQIDTAPARHLDYIRAAAASGVPLIGACTGVFVLAREGLLIDHTACVHPYHAEDFQMAFPRQSFSTRQDYIIENNRITVMGGISTLSLMTELINQHCGPARTAKMVHQLTLPRRDELSGFDRARLKPFQRPGDTRIQRAIMLIEGRKGRNIKAEVIANAVGLSPRQFTRLFQAEIGIGPKRYILEARLRHAHFLIENSFASMTAIAFETGFSNGAHLATAFKAKYGLTPLELRTGKAVA